MLPAPHSSHHQPYTQKQGNQKNTNIWKCNQTSRAQDLSHCVVWFSGFVCLFFIGGGGGGIEVSQSCENRLIRGP